ncbi:MAG: DDE-type integrase/transposase/recombinase [Azoarcus sp.]|nr:DDE-type integrase/transposase/recombinase [Azoarcus sp.]
MAGFGLLKDMVFDWDGNEFRIDRLQANGEILLERVKDGKLSIVPREALLAEYGQGNVSTKKNEPSVTPVAAPIFSRPLDELSAQVRSDLARRRHYLESILAHGKPVFTRAYLEPLIRQAAEGIEDAKPPSVISVYRWYRSYRQSKDTRALIPRIDRRGSRRPAQSDRLLELAAEAIEEAFRASPQASGPNILSRLIAKVENENRKVLHGEPLKAPSLSTLYRLLKRTDAYDKVRLREGKSAADKRFRLVKGRVRTGHILERVEVDHTPLDLFLIDERTGLPLGRPTLTVLIDHHSRMLFGYYLSFGDPSAAAVMGALRHAILPKRPPADVIPGLKIENPWPCYGRPDLLVLDNGLEFHGNDLESVAFDLDIRLQYCPKHQPQFKGTVERHLKTINYFFCHQLPGTSFARLHERGDYDPQKHALLTLGEFKQLFEKWVVDVYAQTTHRGIGTTPWDKWHEGLKHREPKLPEDLHDLQRRIGLVAERSLRRDGVILHGIRYNGDALAPILRAYGDGIQVRVLYDPEDLGEIQVWGPDDTEPIAVQALDQDYANGLTVRQNQLIRGLLRERGAEAEDRPALQRARNDLVQAVERLMASRKQRHRRRGAAIKGMSSNRPDQDLKPKESCQAPQPRPKAAKPSGDDATRDLPDRLPTFQLRRGRKA